MTKRNNYNVRLVTTTFDPLNFFYRLGHLTPMFFNYQSLELESCEIPKQISCVSLVSTKRMCEESSKEGPVIK